MSDVLAADGAKTPVELAPMTFACDQCPRDDFRTAGGLAGHRFAKHGMGSEKPPKSPKPPKPPKGDEPKTEKPLAQRLEGSIGIIGIGVGFLEPYDGRCITDGSRGVAASLDSLAAAYPETRRYIEMLCFDSPALAVVLALLPIVLPILKHHGVVRIDLPRQFAGPADPSKPKAAEGDSAPPGEGPHGPDLSILLGLMADPSFASMAGQAAAAAARPMGEGAPEGSAPPPVPAPVPDESTGESVTP